MNAVHSLLLCIPWCPAYFCFSTRHLCDSTHPLHAISEFVISSHSSHAVSIITISFRVTENSHPFTCRSSFLLHTKFADHNYELRMASIRKTSQKQYQRQVFHSKAIRKCSDKDHLIPTLNIKNAMCLQRIYSHTDMQHLEFTFNCSFIINFRQAPDPLQDGLFRYLMNAFHSLLLCFPRCPA